MRFISLLLPIALIGSAITLAIVGEAVPTRTALAAADDDDDDKGPQGIPTTFTTADPAWKGGPDLRVSRFVALYVPAGQPPTPFLPAGPFTAVFDGKIMLDLGGEHTFAAEGRGNVVVTINGENVLEATGDDFRSAKGKAIRLKKENTLRVKYSSPATGDAQLRLFWESPDMRRESLHWKNLRHLPENKALEASTTVRQGRELLATQRCLKCHAADAETWVKHGGMPELAIDSPSLDALGSRLRPEWLARWIHDPAALRPTATMPRLFADGDKPDQNAIDIAGYLASLGNPPKEEDKADDEEIAGTRLFAQLGCIGCHLPPGQDNFEDERKRIPLRDMGAKYYPAALRAFLMAPEKHYHWIRMPNFKLSETEAQKLTTFLMRTEKRVLFEALPKADIANGKKLLESTGCLNCHALHGSKTTLAGPAHAAWKADKLNAACLTDDAAAAGKSPRFNLTAEQKAALRAFAADKRGSLQREAAPEFAQRQMNLLRCNACHKRGELADHWTQLRDEEAGLLAALPMLDPEDEPKQFKADQTRPTLTWAGEKLKPEWMTQLFAGKLDYRSRPYLRARMPAFPQRAQMLAHGLAFEHGCPPNSPADVKPDPKLVQAGIDLASKSRWNCASCHDVGKTAAVGVFEAPGPNFMYVKDRMRPEYFDRWLWNPLRVEPGTKMPTPYFWGQPSQIKDVLEGDASKQIDALWHYLLQGDRIKPPPQ